MLGLGLLAIAASLVPLFPSLLRKALMVSGVLLLSLYHAVVGWIAAAICITLLWQAPRIRPRINRRRKWEAQEGYSWAERESRFVRGIHKDQPLIAVHTTTQEPFQVVPYEPTLGTRV